MKLINSIVFILFNLISELAFAANIVENLNDYFKNFAAIFEPIIILILVISFISGIYFIFKAIGLLKKFGMMATQMSQPGELAGPLVFLVVGAVLGYDIGSNQEVFDAFINTLFMYIQFIGFLAFVRGWFIVARAGNPGTQPGATGKGLIHIIGGIIAINIVPMINIIKNTLTGA